VTRRPPAWSTPRHHGRGAELDTFLADDTVKQTTTAGSSLKFCLVASGKADLRAAGGKVLTTEGAPLAYGKPGFENPYFIAYGRG
jgi:3'(2'), 5'-bisphosphate nucleotidase